MKLKDLMNVCDPLQEVFVMNQKTGESVTSQASVIIKYSIWSDIEVDEIAIENSELKVWLVR